MSNEEQIQAIEISIEQSKVLIEYGNTLERLMKNPDFKEIILTGYFKEEPARLTELKASPHMAYEQHQEAIIRSLDGIGALQQYINTIRGAASEASMALEQGAEALVDIEAGED